MARKKTNRKKARPIGKRLAAEPIKTVKQEFKKLGPVGKGVAFAFVAALVSPVWARQLNQLPIVGKWTKPVTGFARSLRGRMR